jgi:hypothetical protein
MTKADFPAGNGTTAGCAAAGYNSQAKYRGDKLVTGKYYEFVQGDVNLHGGEAFQVHENRGDTGLVAVFPSDEPELFSMRWDDDCRKIGKEPLPAPTPCSTGSCCPSSS